MTPQTILAAVGQFPQDEAVLRRALSLAAARNARLTVVHVVDFPDPCFDPGLEETLHEQAALAARDRIKAALVRLNADAAAIEIVIEHGTVGTRLIDICKDRQPALIVMRGHQRTRIFERFVGSTVSRVIAADVAPALILRQATDRPYDQVLVATDGSPGGAQALSFTAALLPDATLHLVRAVDVAPELEEAMLRVGTDRAILTAHRETLTRTARDHLRDLAGTIAPSPATRVLKGDPARALIRATRVPQVDLVVVGPGRTGAIRRFFVGSITRRLLHEAACDVLIYRSEPSGA